VAPQKSTQRKKKPPSHLACPVNLEGDTRRVVDVIAPLAGWNDAVGIAVQLPQ